MNIKDKVALVTGSGSGIGEGIAWNLAENGASVVINDIDEKKASKVAKEMSDAGFRASYQIADITKMEQVEAMVSSIVKENEGLDILINNTGVVKDNLILNMPEEDFDFVVNVNLKGAWIVS